jgi:hypothetical protein
MVTVVSEFAQKVGACMSARGIKGERGLAAAMQEAGFEYSATEVGEVLQEPGKATPPFLVGLCEGLALSPEENEELVSAVREEVLWRARWHSPWDSG